MDRIATASTVGAPGDDDTQQAMAAYVQRKRASLAGGASANPVVVGRKNCGVAGSCQPAGREVFREPTSGGRRDACEPDPQPAFVEMTPSSEILRTSSIAAAGPGRAKR